MSCEGRDAGTGGLHYVQMEQASLACTLSSLSKTHS
jgi:hypothetical protein